MGEKSHKYYNISGKFCLFLSKKSKREPKVATPLSLSVPMKILPISLTSKVGRHWGRTAGDSGSTRTMELRSLSIKTGQTDIRFKFRVA